MKNLRLLQMLVALTLASLLGCAKSQPAPASPSVRGIRRGDAPNGRFPGVGLLVHSDGTSASLCTASFVTERTLVTAAHCVTEIGSGTLTTFDPSTLYFSTGESPLDAGSGSFVHAVKVEVHPNYLPLDFFPELWGSATSVDDVSGADIALVELASPIAGAAAYPLWHGGAVMTAGQTATAVGYGLNGIPTASDPEGTPGVQLTASYPFQGYADTADVASINYSTKRASLALLSKGLLVYSQGTDATKTQNDCPGDSGGPIFADHAGSTYVMGVVSFGDGGCTTSTFTAYTAVNPALVLAWVDKTLASWEGASGQCSQEDTTFGNHVYGCEQKAPKLAWSEAAKTEMTLDEAGAYCASHVALSYGGWRLPTKSELVALTTAGGALHLEAPRWRYYWASDSGASGASTVELVDGLSKEAAPWTLHPVLCVRSTAEDGGM